LFIGLAARLLAVGFFLRQNRCGRVFVKISIVPTPMKQKDFKEKIEHFLRRGRNRGTRPLRTITRIMLYMYRSGGIRL